MRFGDTYRLATTNLRKNKRRSITVIMTMAVIFGLIIGVSFLREELGIFCSNHHLGNLDKLI